MRASLLAASCVVLLSAPALAQQGGDDDTSKADATSGADNAGDAGSGDGDQVEVPPPQEAPKKAGILKPPPSTKPQTRKSFVKGGLISFGSRPQTKQKFFGASFGMSALPNDGDSLLNTFFLTVEPQADLLMGPENRVKVGLSVPLQFHVFDARGSFENCLDGAIADKAMGAPQSQIDANAVACASAEKDRNFEKLGKLREGDWDEPSDFAKVIRYITVGGKEQKFYLNINRLYEHNIGHGTVIRHYNPNLNYNTTRVGATFDAYHKFVGFQSMVNDIVAPDVMGVLGFIRPLQPIAPNNVVLSRLSIGVHANLGINVPKVMGYERGVFDPSIDLPIPKIEDGRRLVSTNKDQVAIVGVDVETKLIRTETADLKIYADVSQMVDRGRGLAVGSLWRFSWGKPASQALRIRAEAQYHDPDYLPGFFDSFYDIHKQQYIPAGYRSSDGLAYFPTKLQFVEAHAGGKRRLGGYLEVTYSILNRLTLGLQFRGSKGIGDNVAPGFSGLQFEDYSRCPWVMGTDELNCSGVNKITVFDPGYASLRLHVGIPFKKYLQSFVSYQVFDTSLDNEGLDLFQFDGDNEVLFSGFRLQVLPILFLQGEVRRFYFLQRITNIDLNTFEFEQDHNYHAEWTFAVHLYTGMEF